MTGSANALARPLRIVALTIVPGSLCLGGPALAETRAGVNISASGKVATNPFQQVDGETAFAGSATIAPWLQIIGDQSSINLNGNVTVDEWTQDYGTDTSAAVRLDAQKQLSPYFSISGGGGYSTTRSGIQQALLSRNTPADELLPPTTPLPDVTFGGVQTRTESFNARLGLGWKPGPRSNVDLTVAGYGSRFDSLDGADYNNLSANLGYSHKLTDRTSITANVGFSKSDYLDTRAGDGNIITPQVGVDWMIGSTWTLGASAGASFAKTHRADGSHDNFTSFSGNVRLCNTGERAVLCVNAAQAAQPTALGGISTVLSVGVSYDRRLGERDNLILTARYSSSDHDSDVTSEGTQEFYGASATLNHEFSRRFTAYVSPSYSKVSDTIGSREANFQLDVGVRFRLGAIT